MDAIQKKCAAAVTPEGILSLLKEYVGDFMYNAIKEKLQDFKHEDVRKMLEFIVEFISKYAKDQNIDGIGVIVAAIRFEFGIMFPVCLKETILAFCDSFFCAIFKFISIEKVLEVEHDVLDLEVAGLAARVESTHYFIAQLEQEGGLDESTLDIMIRNIDLQIGINEIGKLKRCIESRAEVDFKNCLKYLKLLVRIFILRHALLFRFSACLVLQKCCPKLGPYLHGCFQREREEARNFLKFFSLPCLNNGGILAEFDPSEHEELATFLKEMHLPLQNLRELFHDKVGMIQSRMNSSIYLGRPFSPRNNVFGMKTSTDNIRIKFKFTAVENTFNLFYIQSPDKDEYFCMNKNAECKYLKKYEDPDTAQWRIIQIHDKGEVNSGSTFAFCNKKWPGQFLCVEDSWSMKVYSLEKNTKPTMACLFTIVMINPEGLLAICCMPIPEDLDKSLKKH